MKHIGHNLAILLCGLLELALVVFLILSMIPTPPPLGVEVDETVQVSCSELENGQYLLQLRGRLVNRGEEAVEFDTLRVTVSDGKARKTIEQELPTLSPRVPYDLFAELEVPVFYDRVDALTVVLDGEELPLSNGNGGIFSVSTLLCAFLVVADAFVLIHFIKQRYYLAQEEREGA